MVMTPCLAMWENFPLGISVGGPWPNAVVAGHRSLSWRWGQLLKCKNLSLELFTRGHFVASNTTHYFARAERGIWAGEPYNYLAPLPPTWPSSNAWAAGVELLEEKEKDGKISPVLWRWLNLPKVCFYLGKFPVYWSQDRFSMVFADQMIAGKAYAVGKKPFIVGVDMDLFEALPPARRPIYFKGDTIRTYARQAEFFTSWKGWQERCKASNYSVLPPPKRYVKGTKMEWPGSPMSEIPMPTPEELRPPEEYPPRQFPPLEHPVRLRLEMSMRQLYSPNPDKLTLGVNL